MRDFFEDKLKIDDISESYRDVAQFLGLDVFIRFCEMFGGEAVYIPTKRKLLMPVRNKVINDKFKEDNYKEIAKEFGISEIQVKNIVHKR